MDYVVRVKFIMSVCLLLVLNVYGISKGKGSYCGYFVIFIVIVIEKRGVVVFIYVIYFLL